MIPFRITVDAKMNIHNAERLDREIEYGNDFENTGTNYIFDGDMLTIDVLIRPHDEEIVTIITPQKKKREAFVFFAPLDRSKSYEGNIFNEYRLKTDYLPRLDSCSVTGSAQTFDVGIATIDIPTQTVTHFEQRNNDPLFNDDEYTGTLIAEVDSNTIKVATTFANGGFNFYRTIL